MLNDVMHSPNLGFYLGEITLYTIVMWIIANESKWRSMGGLAQSRMIDTRLLQVATNILYRHVVASLSWLSSKA